MPLKHEALSEIPLFAGLSEGEIQALAQRAVERRFAPTRCCFGKASRAPAFFC